MQKFTDISLQCSLFHFTCSRYPAHQGNNGLWGLLQYMLSPRNSSLTKSGSSIAHLSVSIVIIPCSAVRGCFQLWSDPSRLGGELNSDPRYEQWHRVKIAK